jgi:hypothetical protein
VLQVTFDVAASGDTTKITMNAGPMGAQLLTDVRVLADRITFKFTPGPVVNCTLMLRPDRSDMGDCLDPDAGKGRHPHDAAEEGVTAARGYRSSIAIIASPYRGPATRAGASAASSAEISPTLSDTAAAPTFSSR